jgi:hypothetical protein
MINLILEYIYLQFDFMERGITCGDPQGRTLQTLNEPFGSYLFSLISFRKQAFSGVSAK